MGLEIKGSESFPPLTKMAKSTFLLIVSIFAMLCLQAINGLTIMPPTAKTAEHLLIAKRAMEYFDSSSDPFHAVQTSINLLEKVGFEELEDVSAYKGKIAPGKLALWQFSIDSKFSSDWTHIETFLFQLLGGKYYFTRNKSTLGTCINDIRLAPVQTASINGHFVTYFSHRWLLLIPLHLF